MHEIAAASRFSLSSSFMQCARESTFIAEYETLPLPLGVYKKASLSKDCSGLARSCSITGLLDMFILFARSLTFFRIPAANLSSYIFLRTIFDFLNMEELCYLFQGEKWLWFLLLLLPILFMQPQLCSHVLCFPCEEGLLYGNIFSNEY